MKLVKSLFVGLGLLLFCCDSLFAKGLYVEFPEVISDGTTTITMSDGVVLDGPAYKGGYPQIYAPFAMDNCVIGKPIKVKFDINLINGFVGLKDRLGLLITTRNSEFGIVTPNSFDILYGPRNPSTFTVPIYAE